MKTLMSVASETCALKLYVKKLRTTTDFLLLGNEGNCMIFDFLRCVVLLLNYHKMQSEAEIRFSSNALQSEDLKLRIMQRNLRFLQNFLSS